MYVLENNPMPHELIISSIQNNLRQLEVVSQNVVNAQTAGYQARMPFVEYVNGMASVNTTAINKQQGSIVDTQRMLDVAILNSNAFVLDDGVGGQVLTRNGNFQIDENNRLNHVSGKAVLGESGHLYIPDAADIRIGPKGEVFANGQLIDTIVGGRITSEGAYESLGKGLYRAEKWQVDSLATQQFSLNSSNVAASREMIKLMELSRHTESLQKAYQALDLIKNSGINNLGETK